MKLFRRITALALTLVVIAMFGISASAASFTETINGDFYVGAEFEGNLTTHTATAKATLYGADVDNIEIVEQRIHIVCSFYLNNDNLNSQGGEARSPEGWNEAVLDISVPAPSNSSFASATYHYVATYIANGVVDCYLRCGPKSLIIP